MQPPPIVLLQVCNLLIAFASALTLMIGVATWSHLGWGYWRIGLVTAGVNLCYGLVVAQGGRCAERWGRARTSMIGALIGLCGCTLGLVWGPDQAGVLAAMLAFTGPALFFPGIAGLFSDSESQGTPVALHRKVSRYNLGWALGNCSAFLLFDAVADHPRLGYSVGCIAFAIGAGALLRWRRLPPRPPLAAGDRAPHVCLPRLTLMSRINLGIACMLGMGMITQLDKALAKAMPMHHAVILTTVVLSAYSATYILTFLALGRWSGWVLRPWRLWWCQSGFVLGAVGLIALDLAHWYDPVALACCGLALGCGYGAAYTSSIYYSLRLPHGASRAAGLHETFLGIGNTAGPLLAGCFLSGVLSGARGLGLFMVLAAVACLSLQALLIPSGMESVNGSSGGGQDQDPADQQGPGRQRPDQPVMRSPVV